MPPYRKTSTELQTRAVVLMEMGVSCREVSRQLKVNVKTIYNIKKRVGESGSVADRPQSGRPKKTSVRQDRALVRYSLSDRRLTSPELRQRMEAELGVTVSSSAIKKRLNSAGLRGCVAVKKPLLRPAKIKSRLEFARRHKHWTVQQWDKVLWSDESAFQLLILVLFVYKNSRNSIYN